jgi:acetylornithine deacetylase
MAVSEAVSQIMHEISDDRVVELERSMIQIPSPTWEEEHLALFLADYMDAAGMDVELQAVRIDDTKVGVQPIGRIKGQGDGRSLMLSGHMDYQGLDEPDRWHHPPFAAIVEDGFVYGRGAKDEKGGVCAAVAAAEAVARSGVRLRGDLIVAPVMGHKTRTVGGGIGARHLMASGVTADMAIVTENSNLGIATTCVGRVTARLQFRGEAGSFDTGPGTDFFGLLASLIERLGPSYGTVPEDSWLSYRTHEDFPEFPKLLYGDLEVGKRSVSLSVNVRIVPGQTESSVKEDLQRLIDDVREAYPGVQATVEIAQPVRYPHQISLDHPLVQALTNAHADTRGVPPVTGIKPRIGAVADSWFFIESGLTDTTVYGPGSIGPDFRDLPDERIAIKDLVDCTRIYAKTIAEICAADL